jgi:hypothetical protein
MIHTRGLVASVLVALMLCGASDLRAQQQMTGPPKLAADAQAALDDLSGRYATDFELHPGWFRDHPIAYYDFGPVSQPVVAGVVIWPIHGFDAKGNPVAMRGQRPIFSSIPGLAPYSGVWRLTYLVAADHVQPNVLRDVASAQAFARGRRATLRPTETLLNLPIVARGSHLAGDSALPTFGWYAGQEVQYFDFGATSLAPVPLFAFTRGADSTGPVLFRDQSNIVDTIPATPPFPDLWSILFVRVDSAYAANTWRSGAAIVGEHAQIESAHAVRNCPVVIVDGARIHRADSPLRAFADLRSPFPPARTAPTTPTP